MEHFGQIHQGLVTSLEFVPNKKQIVSGSEDCTIHIWDFSTIEKIASPPLIIKGHDKAVRSIVLTQTGESIISGGDDRVIRIFDTKNGDLKGHYLGHQGEITHVTVSPNGDLLASCSHDGSIRIWSLD